MGLLAWIYADTPKVFDFVGGPLLAIFPFIVMFLITSIATLRERSSGTLERLLTMPVSKLDILFGYALSFGLDIAGPEWFLMVVALVDALLGTTLGLLASAFARTEFQAVQFMPALILPQVLLCGLIMPVAQLPTVLHWIANCLPLTYAVDAMLGLARETNISQSTTVDVVVVAGFALVAVLLGAVTLRRQTK
jgi:ABC-2 type transport system permease protein